MREIVSRVYIDRATIRVEYCTSLARELGGVLDVLAGKRAEGGKMSGLQGRAF